MVWVVWCRRAVASAERDGTQRHSLFLPCVAGFHERGRARASKQGTETAGTAEEPVVAFPSSCRVALLPSRVNHVVVHYTACPVQLLCSYANTSEYTYFPFVGQQIRTESCSLAANDSCSFVLNPQISYRSKSSKNSPQSPSILCLVLPTKI